MPKTYTTYATELRAALLGQYGGPPLMGSLVVRVNVAKPRPKSTILSAPRGDVDNLAKGVLDACTKTGCFWKDDVQIVALFATKRWADEASIEITINTIEE